MLKAVGKDGTVTFDGTLLVIEAGGETAELRFDAVALVEFVPATETRCGLIRFVVKHSVRARGRQSYAVSFQQWREGSFVRLYETLDSDLARRAEAGGRRCQ